MDETRHAELLQRRRRRRRVRVRLADIPRQSLIDLAAVSPDAPTGEFPIVPILPAPTPMPLEPDASVMAAHAEAEHSLGALSPELGAPAGEVRELDSGELQPASGEEGLSAPSHDELASPADVSASLTTDDPDERDEPAHVVEEADATASASDALGASPPDGPPQTLADAEQPPREPARVSEAISEPLSAGATREAEFLSPFEPSDDAEFSGAASREALPPAPAPEPSEPAPAPETSAAAPRRVVVSSTIGVGQSAVRGGVTQVAQRPASVRPAPSPEPTPEPAEERLPDFGAAAPGDASVDTSADAPASPAPAPSPADDADPDIVMSPPPSARSVGVEPSVELVLDSDESALDLEEPLGDDTVEIGLPALSAESTLPGIELEEIQADEADRLLKAKGRRSRVDTRPDSPIAEERATRARRDTVRQRPPEVPEPPEPPVGRSSAMPPEVPAPPPRRPSSVKRKRPWFESFFSDDYLRTVRPPTPREVARECDFIVEQLRLPPGSSILDVGCGLGLHAIELTRRGYLVVGLDLSLPMLSRASDEAQDEGMQINFLHGDMRDMVFDGAFDGVLCWGTTFGYFDDEENRKSLQQVFRAVKPKGALLVDVVNRDFVIQQQPNLIWFEGDGCVVMEESTFNHFNSRLQVKRTVILDDGRQRESNYSLRLFAAHELGQLLNQIGFRVTSLTGHLATPGVFFGVDSPRIIVAAERRGEAPSAAVNRPPPPPRVSDPESAPES